MAIRTKNSKQNQLIAIISIILLLVAAVAATVISVYKNDVPAMSDSGLDSTTSPTDGKNENPETNTPNATDEQTQSPIVPVIPSFENPLTGLECSEELSKQRPAAIMINNIAKACPQEGISNADVIYECLAEGGITRLLMLVTDYSPLGQTGSIRSSRDYYLDLAQNHDALYFHAGGSEKAYSEIARRNIDNFDGVRMSIPNTFYRDAWRQSNMGMEHSLMITGDGIVSAIKYRDKRTETKADFKSPFNFPKTDESFELDGGDANCVYLPFSTYQSPWLKYDKTEKVYKRWQYNSPHVDKTNGEQLAFTNILVIGCAHSGPLDSAGRIEVTTTGVGNGYYISRGKYVEIKWEKADVDSPVQLFNKDGSRLVINRGKTYVAIFDSTRISGINMNYNA